MVMNPASRPAPAIAKLMFWKRIAERSRIAPRKSATNRIAKLSTSVQPRDDSVFPASVHHEFPLIRPIVCNAGTMPTEGKNVQTSAVARTAAMSRLNDDARPNLGPSDRLTRM